MPCVTKIKVQAKKSSTDSEITSNFFESPLHWGKPPSFFEAFKAPHQPTKKIEQPKPTGCCSIS